MKIVAQRYNKPQKRTKSGTRSRALWAYTQNLVLCPLGVIIDHIVLEAFLARQISPLPPTDDKSWRDLIYVFRMGYRISNDAQSNLNFRKAREQSSIVSFSRPDFLGRL